MASVDCCSLSWPKGLPSGRGSVVDMDGVADAAKAQEEEWRVR